MKSKLLAVLVITMITSVMIMGCGDAATEDNRNTDEVQIENNSDAGEMI